MAKPLMSMKLETAAFSRSISKYMKILPGNVEASLRKLVMELLKLVIMKTPVDFGRARSGWSAAGELVGFPMPKETTTSSKGRKPPPPITEAEKGVGTITASGLRYTATLTNGVEYTVDLERGTSTQAPFGMVRISMRELSSRISGRDQLPTGIKQIYAETWNNLGMPAGAQLRAGNIAQAIGLTPGMNVGAV